MSVPQPLFILASQRSFTSLVCAMLGQHPQGYGVPEINLFSRDKLEELVESSREKRQFMLHGLWRNIAQLYAGEQTIESVEMARRWVHRHLEWTTGEVYWKLCHKIAPLRIVDKSPAYIKNPRAMQRIQETFPQAKYLYMTRHPIDQGKSVMSAVQAVASLVVSDSFDHSTHPPTLDPQYEWYNNQRMIMDFLSTIPENQKMQLRGEDILNQPREYLEKICGWLDFSWNDEVYEQMLRTEASPYACMGPFGALWGNNPGFQKSPVFRHRPLQPSLNATILPWREGGIGLTTEVLGLCQELGYE
jgi:hypothetical protein